MIMYSVLPGCIPQFFEIVRELVGVSKYDFWLHTNVNTMENKSATIC